MSLAALGLARPQSRLVPRFCRLPESTCDSVLRAPQARLAGIPNSVWGTGFYALMLAAALGRLITGRYPAPALLTAAVVSAAAFSVYLLWVLAKVLKVRCTLCVAAHLINFGIAGAYAASMWPG